MRSSVQIRTLHPEVTVVLYLWHRPETQDAGIATKFRVAERADPHVADQVREVSFGHGAFESDVFKESPFYPVCTNGEHIRCVLERGQESFEYPILKDVHAVGATDYVALPIRFSHGPLSAASFVTDGDGGFTDDDMELLTAIMPAVSMCLETHSARQSTRTLLRTYLGVDPGERVLAGQVEPGDVRRIEAAILFSDLRGFTTLSSGMDAAELIVTLNEYFATVAEALEESGGEILKFIGDAMLVVFAIDDPGNASAACSRALQAAIAANKRLDQLNGKRRQRGDVPLNHGLGLHLGAAEYGNIGSSQRLDFTVIGRDVNVASRIEGMCGKLGKRLLASSRFAAQLPDQEWSPVGEYELKGLDGVEQLFSPANGES